MTDVMPRRPDWKQLKEGILSIFGVFSGVDQNRFEAPVPEPLPSEIVPECEVTSGQLVLHMNREKSAHVE
jgi:hypothetical protein